MKTNIEIIETYTVAFANTKLTMDKEKEIYMKLAEQPVSDYCFEIVKELAKRTKLNLTELSLIHKSEGLDKILDMYDVLDAKMSEKFKKEGSY